MLNRIRSRRGFTLLELIVVLIVLGLLAAIAIPTYQALMDKSEEKAAKASVEAVGRNAVALAAIEGDRADWPAQLATAVGEANGVTQADGTDTLPGTADDVLSFNGHDFTLTVNGTVVTAVPVP